MKVLVVFLVGVIVAASAVSFYDLVNEEWKAFKVTYNKLYADESEEIFRMKIFMENKHSIAKHNQLYEKGHVSFKLALNEFADLLHHEFTSTHNGYNNTLKQSLGAEDSEEVATEHSGEGATFLGPANVEIPDAIDWRTKGAVTAVKNQGQCGSCWAFSSTGALEGQHFRLKGVLVSLSEQNLVDCTGRYGNGGCNGGWMNTAFRYIKDNNGIDTEKSYPYEARDNVCRYDANNRGATAKGFVDIAHCENKVKEAVATVGPLAVAIDASQESFRFYSDGVYYEPRCNSREINHAVLIVGYGSDKVSGLDYWIVKNSWGTSWGDQGYIKMVRNKQNNCGIASAASFPLM